MRCEIRVHESEELGKFHCPFLNLNFRVREEGGVAGLQRRDEGFGLLVGVGTPAGRNFDAMRAEDFGCDLKRYRNEAGRGCGKRRSKDG
jgi:hypothetical protein